MRVKFSSLPAAIALACILFLPGCLNDSPLSKQPAAVLTDELASVKAAMDALILETVRETQQPFNWNQLDHATLFDALRVSGHVLAVGYTGGENRMNELLELIYASEGKQSAIAGSTDEVLIYNDNELNFFGVRIMNPATLKLIRENQHTTWVEISNYPIDVDLFMEQGNIGPQQKNQNTGPLNPTQREMILDPFQENPNYVDQVAAFDGSLRTVIRRHNMESAYLEHGIFGEDIDVAIIDNGLLPDRTDFFLDNGYGERYMTGYYNPLWFFPFTQPDGHRPKPTDILGISFLFYDTYFVHGSEMSKMTLTLAPNANIHSVRGSTWTVILFIDQILGICDAIKASADDPDIMVTSMSMGTIFYFNRIASAIEYHYSKGKLFIASAGSTWEGINHLLGVLFPGQMTETVTATGIPNRESTGGEFMLSEGSHGGPENDFTVESTGSSSVAASRTAGMISLIWSANPELTRDELMDVLKQSSYFYQLNGEKHPIFGWGTIDAGFAVELIQQGRF